MKTPKKKTAENFIKDIRRNTRRIFSSEQKIQIVMEALRAEMSVAELCRKYSINESQFYKWNKEFLEAGKKRLAGDVIREATSDEVAELVRLQLNWTFTTLSRKVCKLKSLGLDFIILAFLQK